MYIKVIFVTLSLILISFILSLAIYSVVPYEKFLPPVDTSEVIALGPGVSVEEFKAEQERLYREGLEEKKKAEKQKIWKERVHVIEQRKRGLLISILPWLLIPFLLGYKKEQTLIMIGVLFVSFAVGFLYWFELLTYIICILISFWVKKKLVIIGVTH